MRIIDTSGTTTDTAVGAAKPVGATAPAAKVVGEQATQEGPAAKVTLSARALELARSSAEGADTAKIEQLRASIQEGSFRIDRQAIARRIVDGG